MIDAQFLERWQLLNSRGGGLAAGYWLLRAVARMDVYKLMSRELIAEPGQPSRRGGHFLQLRSADEARLCDPVIYSQIGAHCGWGLASYLERGGRVYALIGESGILCQLNIDVKVGRADTPCPLLLELPDRECFLSFLYTYPEARRQGWATSLIERVSASLAAEGMRACHCHIQATNVRSLNTFLAAGWHVRGWLAASAGGGRYLWTYRRRGLRLDVKGA